MKVTYKERIFIDTYKCIDTVKTINAIDYFTNGTDLIYFRLDRFNYKTIAKEHIIRIEK